MLWNWSNRRVARPYRVLGLLALAALVSGLARSAEIHLVPDGDDGADGASKARAVKTLQRALDLATTQTKDKVDVRVVVWEGTYSGQTAVLTDAKGAGTIVIAPSAGSRAGATRFVGAGPSQTWLVFKSRMGGVTGLTVRDLVIESYGVAISLEADRNDPSKANSGTVIEGNLFRRIGAPSGDDSGAAPTAAIRLVNSQGNRIARNTFDSIRSEHSCRVLHTIYLAHHSSRNTIEKNTFTDMCGSVIKLRDGSNQNVIRDNTFSKIDADFVVDEWFCDKGKQKDCTKPTGECPSVGNRFVSNKLSASGPRVRPIGVRGGTDPRPWCESKDYGVDRVRVE